MNKKSNDGPEAMIRIAIHSRLESGRNVTKRGGATIGRKLRERRSHSHNWADQSSAAIILGETRGAYPAVSFLATDGWGAFVIREKMNFWEKEMDDRELSQTSIRTVAAVRPARCAKSTSRTNKQPNK